MFGKRCSLCGGKLNSRGICTECGLDNSKSDKNYRINRSDCDGMPLTHVHEEKEKYRPDRKADHREINHKETNHKKRDYGKQGYRMNESDMTGKKRRKHVQTPDITNRRRPLKIVILAIIVITVLGNLYEEHKYDIEYAIGDAVQDVFQDTGDQKTNDTDETDYDHYQYVTREIPKEGERADYELSSGNYVAGVEIPEGIYTVTPKDDYDTVQIDDPENSIYLYEYTENPNENLVDFINELEQILPSSFYTNSFSSDLDGISISVTVEGKEAAARTILNIRNMKSISDVQISNITDSKNELGESAVTFSITGTYADIHAETEETEAAGDTAGTTAQ